MIGKGKSKYVSSKELSQRSKEDGDRISNLPDHLICQIIYLLSTEEAVRTSVLSTRWRHVWLWLPGFELSSRKFSDTNAFVSFGDRFLDSSRVTCIRKLKLTLGDNANTVKDGSYFTSWIDAAIKLKIQHLDIDWVAYDFFTHRRLRLHSCETLVYLRLSNLFLDDEVHSRSLKRLSIERRILKVLDGVPGIVIDAPLLGCLSIHDHESKTFIVKSNLESNAKLYISLNNGLVGSDVIKSVPSRSSFRDFLTGISMVGDMTISQSTSQLICLYSKLEPLPQFEYMSRLCVSLHATNSIWLKTFLRSCPNLRSLILEQIGYVNYPEPQSEEDNPKCFLLSLEFVDIYFSSQGRYIDMKLVSYILENSAILKKLTLSWDHHSTKGEIIKELLKIPRRSTKCEVVILGFKRQVPLSLWRKAHQGEGPDATYL
ncbi:hypothetical protein F2Q70_00022727 [Brassica cretica]|uniref:FBD domain-containing protein n=1 Tax=Brassica cretica TaxID=69181 RepID=A0A8S9GLA4_BRACR|nr:hypothetical protein F2Q70_00022727 [Brassica cretica]